MTCYQVPSEETSINWTTLVNRYIGFDTSYCHLVSDWLAVCISFVSLVISNKICETERFIQWNLVIKRSDITKPSYNKVI